MKDTPRARCMSSPAGADAAYTAGTGGSKVPLAHEAHSHHPSHTQCAAVLNFTTAPIESKIAPCLSVWGCVCEQEPRSHIELTLKPVD